MLLYCQGGEGDVDDGQSVGSDAEGSLLEFFFKKILVRKYALTVDTN